MFWGIKYEPLSEPPELSELSRERCKNKAVDYCKTMNVVVVKKIERDIAIV